ncbi:acetyltransferase (GNAT) family protein [Prauserella shujinwangii]|uniref:Acetyltransferase (GNAT) family protein n=1 Tax=Prauserella shujinwangii TaxID=1453103 RepID=A0A2T0LZG3_9PSEU|nr:GNAT family N-acetyltransferase [Prauserella shujinwangii]PRX49507.1 acetyltransferase (GNAT) family protein [Prauserella shujinwangii]
MDWTIEPVPPHHPDAGTILRRYFTDIASRYLGRPVTDAELAAALAAEPSDDLVSPTGLLLVARQAGHPVGCAGVRLLEPDVAELTRVFTEPGLRGRGLGGTLVLAAEEAARSLGARLVRLDTRHDLVEARRLYVRLGYREIDAYHDGPYADHWFEKALTGEPRPPARRRTWC